jgi:hypothetical protein
LRVINYIQLMAFLNSMSSGSGFLRSRLTASVLSLFLTCFSSQALAKFLDIETPQDFAFGTWANYGSLTMNRTTCAAATGGKHDDPKDYKSKVSNDDGEDGFYLYLDGDSDYTGNQRIEISFQHRDTLASDGNTFETLDEDDWESHKHKGQEEGCEDGDNSQLKVDISGAELGSKFSGSYTGQFYQTIKEGKKDEETDIFLVTVTLASSPEVQISHLGSIAFGSFVAGAGGLSVNEPFCIYSEATNGAYRLSVSSDSQDVAGNFYMEDSIIEEKIPLSVLFSASGSGAGTISMTSNYVSGAGNSDNTDCNGGDNATLTFSIADLDLQGASSGSYSELLTIFVEPE